MRFLLISVFISLSGFAGSVLAGENKPMSCPEQLAQHAQHANNLAGDRGKKEYELAKAQVEVQQLKQYAGQLQKRIDELTKAAEPKVEEKKPE